MIVLLEEHTHTHTHDLRCVHTIEQCSTDKIVTNYQWKAERLADDVRSEHQVVYRTLSVFAASKRQTLSGVELYDTARHTTNKVTWLQDFQSPSVH